MKQTTKYREVYKGVYYHTDGKKLYENPIELKGKHLIIEGKKIRIYKRIAVIDTDTFCIVDTDDVLFLRVKGILKYDVTEMNRKAIAYQIRKLLKSKTI